MRMSRLAQSILLVAVAASSAAAQWSGGLKGGVGFGSFTGKHEFSWKPSYPNTVLFLGRDLTRHFGFQLDLGESQTLGTSTAGGGELQYSAIYLDGLAQLRYSIVNVGNTTLYSLAGLTLQYRAACRLKLIVAGLVTDDPCDNASGVSLFSGGAAAGAGVAVRTGIYTLHVETRGALSFRTVELESTASQSVSWSVMAGVSIPVRFGNPRPIMDATVREIDPIRVTSIGEMSPSLPPELSRGIGAGASGKRITLTASDADARTLLIAIAREAGMNLVVSTDVKKRVSVSFQNAAPDAAIAAIIAEAGLTIVAPPASATLPAVIYYQLPVNVNEASAETIAARFGVSSELAKWVAENRPKPN